RVAEAMDAATSRTSEGGDIQPLAYLDLIRSNGLLGLRFPITRADETVIGRGGLVAHIALTDCPGVSDTHAGIVCMNGKLFLDDLGSSDGAFVKLDGDTQLQSGDTLMVGGIRLRIVARRSP